MKRILLFVVVFAVAAVAAIAQDGEAPSSYYEIKGGDTWDIPIFMRSAGFYAGSFDARDNRDDLAVTITDTARQAIPVVRPGDDIEILIVDEVGFANYKAGKSFQAVYSSGRKAAGDFKVWLVPGSYHLLISNRHSYLANKRVKMTFSPENAKSLGVPPPAPRQPVVVRGSFGPGGWYQVPIMMSGNGRFRGSFSSLGGDVEAFVVDPVNFANFTAGRLFRSYYASGFTSAGNFDVGLGAGTYHIVFFNRFDRLKGRQITVVY